MFQNAINKNNGPHSPDYIILYRKGGNEVQNKTLTPRIEKLRSFEVLHYIGEYCGFYCDKD